MKTIIYTQRVDIIESYGERRDCADQRIPDFIYACGYLPVPIPNNNAIIQEFLKKINPFGIILVGGNSLVKYGGNAPERDITDNTLLSYAVKHKIPLYGFCRGMQSILNYFGSTLENVKGHVAVRHEISGIEENSEVNSYHSQGCLSLNCSSLEVVMRSEDGVIEKVKHKELPIIGTMWHPERENPFRERDIAMMKGLFDDADN